MKAATNLPSEGKRADPAIPERARVKILKTAYHTFNCLRHRFPNVSFTLTKERPERVFIKNAPFA